MAQIMSKSSGFGGIRVQGAKLRNGTRMLLFEILGQPSGDLSDF